MSTIKDYTKLKDQIQQYQKDNPSASVNQVCKTLKIWHDQYYRAIGRPMAKKSRKASVPKKPIYEKVTLPTAQPSKRITVALIQGDLSDITAIIGGLQ